MREITEQEQVRRDKLKEIKHPYPERYETNYTLKEAMKLEDGTENVKIAGRIMAKRKIELSNRKYDLQNNTITAINNNINTNRKKIEDIKEEQRRQEEERQRQAEEAARQNSQNNNAELATV